MSKYFIQGESVEAIADGFRTSRGTEQKYTLDEMAVLAAEKVGGNSGGGGMDVAAHSNGITELTMFYGGPASIPALTIRAAFESAVAE